ncbi:hypothetical protein ACQ4LH_21755, partial [Pseudomonas peli]
PPPSVFSSRGASSAASDVYQRHVLAAGQGGTHPGGRETFGHSALVDPWGRPLYTSDAADYAPSDAAYDILAVLITII